MKVVILAVVLSLLSIAWAEESRDNEEVCNAIASNSDINFEEFSENIGAAIKIADGNLVENLKATDIVVREIEQICNSRLYSDSQGLHNQFYKLLETNVRALEEATGSEIRVPRSFKSKLKKIIKVINAILNALG